MMENDFEFLQKLENFFSSPSFTSALGAFLSEHVKEIDFKPLDEEQPLKNYDIYGKYTQMVEQQLENFMLEEGLQPQEIYSACQRAQSGGNSSWLSCIDYLVASTEYESFMDLAFDHHCMMVMGDVNEGEEWAPPPDDDSSEQI